MPGESLQFTAADFEGENAPGGASVAAPATQDEDIYSEIEIEEDGESAALAASPAAGEPAPARRTAAGDEVLEGDWVPENLRGKSMREALGLFTTLQTIATNALNTRPVATPEPVQPAPTNEDLSFTEDDFSYGADPNRFNEKLNRLVERKTQPFVSSLLTMAARDAEATASRLPYYSLFSEQIKSTMAQASPEYRANPAVWEYVHNQFAMANREKVVEHEIAKRTAAAPPDKPAPGFSETSSASVGAPNGKTNGKKQYKLTKQEMDYCRGAGIDPRAYAHYKYNGGFA